MARRKIVYSEDFERFWKVYPNKMEKERAFAEWEKMRLFYDVTVDEVIQSVEEHKKTKTWNNPKITIIYPERFIKRRYWENKIHPHDIYHPPRKVALIASPLSKVNTGEDCIKCGGKGYGYIVLGTTGDMRTLALNHNDSFDHLEIAKHPCPEAGKNHDEARREIYGEIPKDLTEIKLYWRRIHYGFKRWFKSEEQAIEWKLLLERNK